MSRASAINFGFQKRGVWEKKICTGMLSVDFSTLHFLYASLFVCLFVFYWKVLYHLRTVFSLDMSGCQWISSVRVNISAKKNIRWSEIALVSLVYFVRDVIGLENWRHPFSQSDASRTNRKLIACVVPRLGNLACTFLEFSLATLLVTSWENFTHCIVETPASLSSNLARRNSRPF